MNQTKYVGLDVHKASTSIAVLTAQGQLLSQAVIKTEAAALADFFNGLTGPIHLTFEEGCHAQWLFETLQPLVTKLIVCDPKHNKLLLTGNKTDRLDAQKLATLLRGDLLKNVYHSTLSSKALKERVRLYENLTEDMTRVSNRIKAVFRARGIACAGDSLISKPSVSSGWRRLKSLGRKRGSLYSMKSATFSKNCDDVPNWRWSKQPDRIAPTTS